MATYYFPAEIFLAEYSPLGLVNLTGTVPNLIPVFIQGTSQANQDVVIAAMEIFDWVPITPVPDTIPVPPDSNPFAFVAACWEDNSLSAEAKINIANLSAILIQNIDNGGVITQYWSYLIASAPGWLDSNTQNTVLGYASTYGVPLT